MGHTKRVQKPTKQHNLRPRNTRSKGKVLSDPAQNTQLLTEQLRNLGLYAAPTLGDGNCLFRALADQLHGSPAHHSQLRIQICDWIESHKARYEPFVEDDRDFDTHLRCMRQNATYGGHMELSAFAHLSKRNVKVIQPGLVYVIEWNAGGEPINMDDNHGDDLPLQKEHPSTSSARDKRHAKRETTKRASDCKGKGKHREDDSSTQHEPSPSPSSTIYVAYHDWEHFSSIRNLRGPHTGLPNVCESSAEDVNFTDHASQPRKKRGRPPKVKLTLVPPTNPSPLTSEEEDASSELSSPEESRAASPADIPLPASRSPSPLPGGALLHSEKTPLGNISNDLHPRVHRSPKRTFDESSAASGSSTASDTGGGGRRTRSRLASASALVTVSAAPTVTALDEKNPEEDHGMDVDIDIKPPTSGRPSSSSPPLSSSSLSSQHSSRPPSKVPPPSPPPTEPQRRGRGRPRKYPVAGSTGAKAEKPLTRRQRKALGLPKERPPTGGGPGRIVIPGGRFKKGAGGGDEDEGAEKAKEEWRTNGTGRVDVRGFRELKI